MPKLSLFLYYENAVIDNVSVVEQDAEGNPTVIELSTCGKLIAKQYIQYDEDENVINVKTDYVPPPLEWWYA